MALITTTGPRVAPVPGRTSSPFGAGLIFVSTMVVVALLTIAGISLALPLLGQSSGTAGRAALADPASGHLALGQPVRTSFGSITAAEAEVNNGLSTQDLGGMSHGVSSLVGSGSAQVNVVVTLVNTGKAPVGLKAGQFRLLRGPGTAPVGQPVKVAGTTLQAGLLSPGSSLDARVTFVTPTDGSALWLEFADPSGGARIRIALGRTTNAAAPSTPHH